VTDGPHEPTYRDVLSTLERQWGDYRRALRRRDRPQFDRLFEHARAHADAAGALTHHDPVVPVLLSVALARERRIAAAVVAPTSKGSPSYQSTKRSATSVGSNAPRPATLSAMQSARSVSSVVVPAGWF